MVIFDRGVVLASRQQSATSITQVRNTAQY